MVNGHTPKVIVNFYKHCYHKTFLKSKTLLKIFFIKNLNFVQFIAIIKEYPNDWDGSTINTISLNSFYQIPF